VLSLNAEAIAAIRAEGEKAYPDECCGFLCGDTDEKGGRRVEGILPVANASEREEKFHRFRIEPDDFLAASRAAGAAGLDIIGFYHSHPDHPAVPSEYDLQLALPCCSYVIVAVGKGMAEELTSWELSDDRSRFNQEL
jgi:proteasome lid subunit RPN8/RPN11